MIEARAAPAGDMLARLSGFLEGDYSVFTYRVPRRYVVSASVVALVKLAMAAALYVYTGLASADSFWMDAARVEPLIQNGVLLDAAGRAFRWAYLFLGWDSAWYASIASGGYSFSDQSFAFMPGLPFLTRLFQSALGGPLPAIVLCCLVSGVLWVPLFESVAEHYVGRRAAFLGTLLFALSPFTLLFTTVAYAEGLFLLLTLAAWKLYLDKRYLSASLASALVALVRIPGFLIVLPMVVGLLSSRGRGDRLRGLLIGAPTAFALLLWVGFMGLSAGDPLAVIHNSEWSGMYTLPTYLTEVLPPGGLGALTFPTPFLNVQWLLPLAVWCSIVLPPLLVWRLRGFDRGLLLYCLAYLAGVLVFGAVISLPRFVAVLFPLWIPVAGHLDGRRWPLLLAAVSFVVCLVLWVGFIGGVFVG
jgi:hypothetical protein